MQSTVAIIPLADESATQTLASALSKLAHKGDVLALWGDLGAGKSTLARAFIRALSGAEIEVPSPTFTLVQAYDLSPTPVFHFDLYRLSDAEEAFELDIDDAFADGISLIEWPDRLGGYLPKDRLDLTLRITAGDGREAVLEGTGDWSSRLSEAGLA